MSVDHTKADIVIRDELRKSTYLYDIAFAYAVYAYSLFLFGNSTVPTDATIAYNNSCVCAFFLTLDIVFAKAKLCLSKARHSYYLYATATSDISREMAKANADLLDVEAAKKIGECTRLYFIFSRQYLHFSGLMKRSREFIVEIMVDAVKDATSPEEAATRARGLCLLKGINDSEAFAAAARYCYREKVALEVSPEATAAENYYSARTEAVFFAIMKKALNGATSPEDALKRALELYNEQAEQSRARAVKYNSNPEAVT